MHCGLIRVFSDPLLDGLSGRYGDVHDEVFLTLAMAIALDLLLELATRGNNRL
jgi:hypothetical protein